MSDRTWGVMTRLTELSAARQREERYVTIEEEKRKKGQRAVLGLSTARQNVPALSAPASGPRKQATAL